MRERHAADMESCNLSRSEEIAMLERRHAEGLTHLKRLHEDELATIKQRSRDGVALEQLANQIRTTTGSLKFIEEKISAQTKGNDAVREGQYEIRERLLVDMEEKARERADNAEAEVRAHCTSD